MNSQCAIRRSAEGRNLTLDFPGGSVGDGSNWNRTEFEAPLQGPGLERVMNFRPFCAVEPEWQGSRTQVTSRMMSGIL
jgi:hypothetical protein